MSNITFCIPEHETIPTRLRLKIEKDEGRDIIVNYRRLPDNFDYEFEFYNIETAEEAEKYLKDIVSIMCNQSFDHGAKWRVADTKLVESKINSIYQAVTYVVGFRIKDSY